MIYLIRDRTEGSCKCDINELNSLIPQMKEDIRPHLILFYSPSRKAGLKMTLLSFDELMRN